METKTNNKKYPLMYKGYLIKESNGKLSAELLSNGIYLHPLYNSWDKLKLIIDNLKY